MDHESVLRALQSRTVWGAHSYTDDFRADPRPHRDASHALAVHVPKAIGKVATFLQEHAQHATWNDCDEASRRAFLNAIADVLICTLRGANTIYASAIDLASMIDDVAIGFDFDYWSLEDPVYRLLEAMGKVCGLIDTMDHTGSADRNEVGRWLCSLWLCTVHVLSIVTIDEHSDVLSIVESRLLEKGIGPA